MSKVENQMRPLMDRVKQIRDEYMPGQKKDDVVEKGDGPVDPFMEEKTALNKGIREIREMIKKRNEMEAERPRDPETVRLARDVRKAMGDVTERERLLRKANQGWEVKMQKRIEKARKKAGSAKATDKDKQGLLDMEDQVRLRNETLDVLKAHIDECSRLMSNRGAGQGKMGAIPDSELIDPTVTSLPDVDDPQFLLLKKNDEIIDGKLDVLGEELKETKQIALDMSERLATQGELLDTLDEQVDKTQEKLTNVNQNLKRVIDMAGKRNCCCDIVLLLMILGMIGLLVMLIKTRTKGQAEDNKQ